MAGDTVRSRPSAPPSNTSKRRDVSRRAPLKLGSLKDVPEYQQRPFILTGYRMNCTGCSQCLQSAVAIHNETANIWSHVLGLIFIVYRVFWVVTSPEAYLGDALFFSSVSMESALIVLLYFVTCNCLFWSAFYHARHCDTERVCFNCFYADLAAVIVLMIVSMGIGMTVAFRCFPLVKRFYMSVLVLQALAMTYCVAAGGLSDKLRTVIFAICGCFGVAPSVHFFVVGNRPEVAHMWPHIAGVLACYGAGASIYLARFPESRWPGAFDFFGQSHNLWHFCAVVGMLVWLRAIEGLVRLGSLSPC